MGESVSALGDSYRQAAASIKFKHNIWVKGSNGWYHTYNRKIVLARIKDLLNLAAAYDLKYEVDKL